MSRLSCDLYKTEDGKLIPVDGMTHPPKGSTLWTGFSYSTQQWYFEGKPDTRTLEQLLAAREQKAYESIDNR